MSDPAHKLSELFAMDASSQQEQNELFERMPTHPAKRDLIFLHDLTYWCVFEAEALLDEIDAAFATGGPRYPSALFPQMLLKQATLPSQIETDRKLVRYLQREHDYLKVVPT